MSARATLAVRAAAEDDAAAWDAFVAACPEATFFHRWGWRRVIARSFGHRTHYLLAEAAGEVRGVLPLTRVRSRLFGDALVGNAFCVYGGPAAVDAATGEALADAARALADRLGVDHLELRCREPQGRDWPTKNELYATFRKAITGDAEADMKAIPRKQRAMVRKGMAAGLTSVVDATADRAHAIYADSVHRLGTPVFPRRYFASLKEEFGSDCEVLTILHEERPVAAVMSFYFRDEVLPYYGGGTRDARALAANDFMYWEVMRRAGARGCRLFDFGRSKRGTGAFSFKKNWGFTPEPLHYQYYLRASETIPEVNPLNPKYRLMVGLWKRLPLALANALGPRIVRGLG